MLEPIFTELAKKHNGEYNVENINVRGKRFSRLPISTHHFNFTHLNTKLKVKYEFGNHNLAEIKFVLEDVNKIPDIQINAREHLFRLFSFNKKVWKFKSKSKADISLYEFLLNENGLTSIAKDFAFEPQIHGKWNKNKFEFYTFYSLAFENKENSLKPVIEFHKMIIEHLKNKYES